MSNTLSKIKIINHARYLAGLDSVGEPDGGDEPDEIYYENERVKLLNTARFEFSKKTIEISSQSTDKTGYFILPRDFLMAVYPSLADRQGKKAKLYPNHYHYGHPRISCGVQQDAFFTYVSNVRDTELFEIGFVDTLTTGMAMRYAQEKADMQRYQLLAADFNTRMAAYTTAENSNTPVRMYY